MKALRRLIDEVAGWFKATPGVLFPTETSLLALPEFVPEGFVHGVEILNDDRTPMEFVAWTLEKHVGLDRAAAVRTMLHVHDKGGILLALASKDEANRIATLVTYHAGERKHPLVCRAVSAEQAAACSSQKTLA
jgi:ATP-dependent Clp protease adapter protein ClpS